MLPKCLLVSMRARCAICSKYGSAAGDRSALKSSTVQVSCSSAILTSRAVYLDASYAFICEMTFSQISDSIFSMPGRYSIGSLRDVGSVSKRCFFSSAASERRAESTKN